MFVMSLVLFPTHIFSANAIKIKTTPRPFLVAPQYQIYNALVYVEVLINHEDSTRAYSIFM